MIFIFIRINVYIQIDMRQTIRLTESELRNLIEESVNEAMMNEGKVRNALRSVRNGFNSAFGRDVERFKQGARNAGNTVVQGAKDIGRGVAQDARDAGRAVVQGAKDIGRGVAQDARDAGRAVVQGAKNIGRGVSNRYNDFKVGYNAERQNNQLNDIKNTVQTMIDNGTLGKGSTVKAAQKFIATLDQAIQNNNYAANNPRGIMANRLREEMERNAYRNRYRNRYYY
jgi:hypothetical protein